MAAVIEFLLKEHTDLKYTATPYFRKQMILNIYVLNKLNFGFYMICVI